MIAPRSCILVRSLWWALLVLASVASEALSQQGRITGSVTDSVHNRPLAGATIVATSAAMRRDTVFHSAITNAAGAFVMDVDSGRYTITVEHSFVDSTGIGVPALDVRVPAGGSVAVALGLPSVASLRRAFCPLAVRDTSLGVVLGVVRRADGLVAPRAIIVFSWSDFEVDRGTATVRPRQLTASVTADSSGIYRACGLPVARTLLVQAQSGADQQSGVLEEQIGEAGVLVRDFHTSSGAVATPVVRSSVAATQPVVPSPADTTAPLGRFLLTGRVQGARGEPVGGAQVRLFGTPRSATSAQDGTFRLAGLPGGTQGIEVVALGFYPRRLRVEMGDVTAPVVVRLERAAVVLDSMRILAKRAYRPDAASAKEFDARLATGRGVFITEEQIERRHAFETSDLLKLAPGVRVHGFGSEARIAAARGRTTIGNTECAVDIFIDGVRGQQADINALPPEALHGVEIYTVANAPAKYGVGPCGAILLWTK